MPRCALDSEVWPSDVLHRVSPNLIGGLALAQLGLLAAASPHGNPNFLCQFAGKLALKWTLILVRHRPDFGGDSAAEPESGCRSG